MTRNVYALGAVAIAAAIVLTACGGSSNNGGLLGAGGGTGAAGDTNIPAAASSALAEISKAAKAAGGGNASSALSGALGGALASVDVTKLCAAVSSSDIQKLFKDPAPKVTVNPGECDWGGGGITVDIDLKDTTKQFYPGGAFSGSATPLPGVGDMALWTSPIKGMTVPFITSRKGNTDCSISPGLDVDQTSMPYTGSAPFFKIADADALQYATEEGQVCNDILNAAG